MYHKSDKDKTYHFPKTAHQSQLKPWRAKQHWDFCMCSLLVLSTVFLLPACLKPWVITHQPLRDPNQGRFSSQDQTTMALLGSSCSSGASHPFPPSLPTCVSSTGEKTYRVLSLCSSPSPPTVIPLPRVLRPTRGILTVLFRIRGAATCFGVCSPSPVLSVSQTHDITLPYPFFIYFSSWQRDNSFVTSLRNFLIFLAWKSEDCVCPASSVTT